MSVSFFKITDAGLSPTFTPNHVVSFVFILWSAQWVSSTSWFWASYFFPDVYKSWLHLFIFPPALLRCNWQVKSSVFSVQCLGVWQAALRGGWEWALRILIMCLWGDGCSLNLAWKSFPCVHQNHRAIHLQLTQRVCVLSRVPLFVTPGL